MTEFYVVQGFTNYHLHIRRLKASKRTLHVPVFSMTHLCGCTIQTVKLNVRLENVKLRYLSIHNYLKFI